MHPLLERLREEARASRRRIVLPEGDDPRVQEAARRLAEERLAEPVLVVRNPLTSPVETVCPRTSPRLEAYAAHCFRNRSSKGLTEEDALVLAARPMFFGALMVALGDADGFVGGAAHTTSETVRAGLMMIGKAPGVETVFGSVIIAHPNPGFGANGAMTFADCAVVAEPTPAQLAEIGMAAAELTRRYLRAEPVVGMLSFSTRGSARHAAVDRMVEATRLLRERAPDLLVEGELQLDAALIPEIAASKAPGSHAAGRVNTLIFPNLSAGNIGYKLAERLGGAAAIGPILQGLAKPANDLSRGSDWSHVFHTALFTAAQAGPV